MAFDDLGLSANLLAALNKLGLSEPTAIQILACPVLAAGKDTYISSETGSGKTLAYLLPLYNALVVDKAVTQVIVIAPTHELALQIHRVSCDLAQHAGLAVRNVLLIGGTSLDRQLEKLKKKPQIVIGTPGRVLELIERGKVKVTEVKTLVIDEADRLLAGDSVDMLRKIIRACPGQRQLVFVSATEQSESTFEIADVAPNLVRLQAEEAAINPNIDHFYLLVEERDKPELLRKLIHATKTERAIVFVHRNETAEIIAARLTHHKITVADLHGAYEKEDRKNAMQDFRSGKARVLIASDVAARGLDIPNISHVFNLDIPSKSKDYLHRVGRVARAGARGVAISLLVESELRLARRLKRDLGIKITEIGLRGGNIVELESNLPEDDVAL
jgi:ATP-dependent RNA helicase DeaD